MVARRKPPKPKGYKDGGAVIPDDVRPPYPENVTAPGPDILKEQAEAAKAAQDPRVQIAAYVDSMGVTGAKREFLIENPQLLSREFAPGVAFNYQKALSMGVEDDSPEMFNTILSGWREDMERQKMKQADMARHAASMLRQRTSADPPELPPLPSEAIIPEQPPAERKRSIPMSAPVSRSVPPYSGKPAGGERSITLTPEQREIARNSFGPVKDQDGNLVDLTDEQKERLYAQNLRKLNRMRESGEYRITSEENG